MRISDDDESKLDALASRLPMKKRTIARMALRLGLAELAKNPAAIFQTSSGPPDASPPAPSSRPRATKKK
jgi:hypothetical protein